MNLISSAFDGKSYGAWRKDVVIALSAKDKLGFSDGTISIPDESPGLQSAWSRENDMVMSWLLNSLSNEIVESVLYSHSAKDLWNDLEDKFGKANGAKLFQLQKELSVVVQKNSSVSSYFTKMKSLWDELDTLINFSTCSCECVCVENLKTHQDQRLLQFLIGLNDTYIRVRSNILMSSPLPTIGKTYSMVIQDEKQREIHCAPIYPGDSASFIVAQQGSVGKKSNFRDLKGKKSGYEGKKNNSFCSYYKKPGHMIGECYRLVGLPRDFKFTNQKKYQGSI
ncbi:uncharacterized protein [Nicotiana tomentosiformis]|uniref:uncharacterized protein n=1 Tax=Nicotiana tomentosiformis TaxID=4098 RepID=UPI00051B7944|nr:uncharacterized protein LOC104101045 [Nicotiana tomentosiformis]